MRQRPSLMGTTGEFTGGCIDATIATPDVPIAAPTTTVLPRTTTVLPRTTTGGGTGPIEVAQRPHRRCRPPGLITCRVPRRSRPATGQEARHKHRAGDKRAGPQNREPH